MLWGTHDHHRDVRALASAPHTTAPHSTNREKFAVTGHSPQQFTAAASSLQPTIEFAPTVSDAPKPPLASGPHRQRPQIQRQVGQIASRPAPATPDATSPRSAENRNTHRPASGSAGSFLGDFRTPRGARNSSRQRSLGERDGSRRSLSPAASRQCLLAVPGVSAYRPSNVDGLGHTLFMASRLRWM